MNKKNEFSENSRKLAELAKAISHPARIQILETLAKKRECICGEIVNVIPLSQSTVSQHIRELKEVGFIQGEVNGSKSCYCINWNKIEEFFTILKLTYKSLKKYKKSQTHAIK